MGILDVALQRLLLFSALETDEVIRPDGRSNRDSGRPLLLLFRSGFRPAKARKRFMNLTYQVR